MRSLKTIDWITILATIPVVIFSGAVFGTFLAAILEV